MKFALVLFFSALIVAETVMVTRPPVNRGTTGASLPGKPIKIANRGECLNMCANLGKPQSRSACKQVCMLEFPSQVPVRPTPRVPVPRG
ncbi:hypothetical protein PRIPAC_85054 [Pristionchus pacificus]|uniref:Uncharacterized protein n=1 Tax=Pristionchus pacificus TaxID=54126 RepID=A0A2A6BV23_PRIPA|nr:hypothetical protein PRIPAC_85054 [Pristionchus pacificus]|eukprot:PDM69764.1 hypothetical protein PRIPAC_44860 [Pristionchus pacificus]